MKKRFPALFLALALCLGLAVPAFAANAGTSAELYAWISAENYPYVSLPGNEGFRVRGVSETGAYNEPITISDEALVVPKSEYFYVGLQKLANHEETLISVLAFSDPDGDGIYSGRIFQQQKESSGAVIDCDVLPIPEGGKAYKMPNNVSWYGNLSMLADFSKVGDRDYALTADKLYELFGDNTIIEFYSGETLVGRVLLSAGAFDDVPGLGWYSDPVAWAADKGITTGTGEGIFEPASDCTQSQILTFLWRAEGKPQAAKAPVTEWE